MFDILPPKPVKVFCYPLVFDISLVILRLDGNALQMGRFAIASNMINSGGNPACWEFTEGFKEVSPEEFVELVNKHASEKSVRGFTEEWERIYGRS